MKRLTLAAILAAVAFATPVRAQWLVSEMGNGADYWFRPHHGVIVPPVVPSCSVDETNTLTVALPPGNGTTVYQTQLLAAHGLGREELAKGLAYLHGPAQVITQLARETIAVAHETIEGTAPTRIFTIKLTPEYVYHVNVFNMTGPYAPYPPGRDGTTDPYRLFEKLAGGCAIRPGRIEPARSHQPTPLACRWEHRFAAVPAANAGVLRVWTRKAGAKVRIEAFDRTTGEAVPIQSFDTGRRERPRELTSPVVTLGDADTVSRFSLPEGEPGNQRVLVVSHAEHVNGMRAITALLVRRTSDTPQVIQPDVVEHCAPGQ